MSMLTLQILALILLFGLVGALVGWLIRPLFYRTRTTGDQGRSSGSAASARMGAAKTPVNIPIVTAAAATAVSVNSNKDQAARQAAIEADKKHLAAEAKATRNVEKAMADEAAAAKVAADKVAAAKRVEENRIADEEARANQAARAAAIEADRRNLAAEGRAARQAEAICLAEEKAKAEQADKNAAAKIEKAATEKTDDSKAINKIAQKGAKTVTRLRGNTTAQPVKPTVNSPLDSSAAVPEHMQPLLLSRPKGGKADNLKRIKGIGKVLERNLHGMGIYHYEQLTALTPDNISWLTDYMSFPEGRIDAEKWVSQAKALTEGKQTEYSQRFDKGDTPYK